VNNGALVIGVQVVQVSNSPYTTVNMSLQTPPKKKRIKRVYRHPNSLFEKWLQEWYDEAKARESQMKFNYARAIKSLRLFPLPLYRGADCKVLSGFGDKICQQIERRMEKHIQEFGPIDWEEYHQVSS
ncbi:unnamed protein product, partial [Meganyctiphanes norvegica]